VRGTVVAPHGRHVVDLHEVEGSLADEVISECIIVPDFDAHARVIGRIKNEGIIPGWLLPSELADLGPVLLPSEVDLHVGILY
jgi:hypothetical protein